MGNPWSQERQYKAEKILVDNYDKDDDEQNTTGLLTDLRLLANARGWNFDKLLRESDDQFQNELDRC